MTAFATAICTVFSGATGSAAAATPPLTLGAYAAGFSGPGSQLSQFESLLGSKLGIASSFRGSGDVFPDATQKQDAGTRHSLLIAWDLGATPATRYATFPAHQHDRYLTQVASAVRSFGAPVYIRPWAEMNGDWQPFQPTPDGSRPAGGTYQEFTTAWRYLVTFFRNHGATNARWVFNPTTDTYAETTPVATIWPGAGYVDVLGLDGYNWGNGGIFTWRSYADIYTAQYRNLVALAPTLPVWICEVGSKEPSEDDGAPVDSSHSKATWVSDMFQTIGAGQPQVKAMVLFDVRKERDWRIESDSGALTEVRAVARAGSRIEGSGAGPRQYPQ